MLGYAVMVLWGGVMVGLDEEFFRRPLFKQRLGFFGGYNLYHQPLIL